MRRIAVLLLLLVVSVPLSAQSEIDRNRDDWREGRRNRYFTRENMFELTPFGGYRWGGTLFADRTNLFGQDVDVASNGDYGVNLGIPLGISRTKLELMVNRQDTDLQIGGGLFTPSDRLADMHITYYHAGIQVPFSESYSASPFIVLSAGIANLRPDVRGISADNRFSASAGVGVKVPFNRNVGLRVEGRGYFTSLGDYDNRRCTRCYNDYNHDLYQGELNMGLVISF